MRPTRAKTPARTPGGLGGIRTPARTPMRAAAARQRPLMEDTHKDPVEVYCRVRPNEEEEEASVKVIGDTKVQLTPPISSRAYTTGKETQYSFKG